MLWQYPVIDAKNKSGSMEFSVAGNPDDFFTVTIFGESSLTGWFPFPGGGTIGLVLLLNLIAAKMTRFHVAAHGQRLVWGTVVLRRVMTRFLLPTT